MALPLLLGLGLGYLGGAQYLLKKSDDRQAESLLGNFEAQMPGLQGAEQSAWWQNQANQLMDSDPGFLSANKADQARSLLDAYQQAHGAQVEQMAQQEQMNRELSYNRTDQLEADYNRNLKVFGSVVQPAYQQAVNALGPEMNSADSVAALYNFFNIMEPGGRVTANEDGSFTGIGGSSSKVANWLNSMRGEGLDKTTREQILQAINNQYRPQYERAQRQRTYYEGQMRDYGNQGLNVGSPFGSLGIDYDTGLTESFMPTDPAIPDGFSPKRGG